MIGAGTLGLDRGRRLGLPCPQGSPPPRGRSWSVPATPTSARWPRRCGATAALPPDQLTRACGAQSGRSRRRPDCGRHATHRRRRRRVRLRGLGGVDRAGPRDGPPTGAGHAGGDAGPDQRGPGAAVAPRGAARGRLCLRDRERFGTPRRSAPSTSPSKAGSWRGASERAAGLGDIPSRPVRGGPGPCRQRGTRGAVKMVFDSAPDRRPGRDRRRHSDSEKKGCPMSPRPGFVLEVDGSTPPLFMWNGEGY